ncbi:hypothetical protein G3I60_01490 [Streptomyces sp. SID13666]|nr:hypothetical protein [Streptomyces sp. SID13666]NEA69793.1 hypothetical protein [Streptomyces sp. SID13588]
MSQGSTGVNGITGRVVVGETDPGLLAYAYRTDTHASTLLPAPGGLYSTATSADEQGATAGTTFPDGDFRSHCFRGDRPAEVERHVDAIVDDLGIAPGEIAETALRYVLSAPAVSTVIPGMRSVRNVEPNTAVSDGRPLTADQLAVLAKHRWQRSFYA